MMAQSIVHMKDDPDTGKRCRLLELPQELLDMIFELAFQPVALLRYHGVAPSCLQRLGACRRLKDLTILVDFALFLNVRIEKDAVKHAFSDDELRFIVDCTGLGNLHGLRRLRLVPGQKLVRVMCLPIPGYREVFPENLARLQRIAWE